MRKSIFIFLVIVSVANAQTVIKYSDARSQTSDVPQSWMAPQALAGSMTIEELKIPYLETEQSARRLTGVLSQDLFAARSDTLSRKDSLDVLETRSSLKAGLFSLLIPGAGQVYNGGTGNFIKAAGFLAIEAAAIAANIVWTNKANNKTTYFENYADGTPSQWSTYNNGNLGYLPNDPKVHYYNVYKYAQWVVTNYAQLEQQNGTSSSNQTIISDHINNILKNKTFDPSIPPWMQVSWYDLNTVEFAMGGYFSHQLPQYGQQQYYELIGKYEEFREGWSDEDPTFLAYTQLQPATNLSGYYMDQRGLANNYYGYAGTALGVLLANHFLSAIEAAIWAHGHNKLIETSVNVTPLPQGLGYQTQVNLAVHF